MCVSEVGGHRRDIAPQYCEAAAYSSRDLLLSKLQKKMSTVSAVAAASDAAIRGQTINKLPVVCIE